MQGLRAKKKFFSKVYDENIDNVYRFIFLKVGAKEITQDLCSEVFLRFWQSMEAGTEIVNSRAFIYQIARNLIVDHYRQKGQEKERTSGFPVEEIEINGPQANPEKQAILASDLNEMQRAISRIKDEYQDVIIWYYLDEISIREIAQMTGKTENNIRVIVHRALETLRNLLSEGKM